MTSSVTKRNPWILRPPGPPPDPSAVALRLFAFPHAGSGAYCYHEWPKALPAGVEVLPVEYPGRNSRRREPCATGMRLLVAALADALAPLLAGPQPYALFGHSLGAWVAYALTQELQMRGAPLPVKLYASGNRSPLLAGPVHDISAVTMHKLDPVPFWEAMEQRYGPNPALEDPDIRAMCYPVLKADFELVETFQPAHGSRALPCPLVAIGGDQDNRYRQEQLAAWQDCAAPGNFEERWFSGGHFYLSKEEESRDAFLAWLAADLQRLLAGDASVQGAAAAEQPAAAAAAGAEAVEAASVAAADATGSSLQEAARPPAPVSMKREGGEGEGLESEEQESSCRTQLLFWRFC